MSLTPRPAQTAETSLAVKIRAHIAIARFDHWTKNVFVLPGIIIPLSVTDVAVDAGLAWRILIGMLATGFIASSNYVLNEVLDAPYDRLHPIKKDRPVARGLVNVPIAYAQWLLLLVIGMGLAALLSSPGLTWTLGALWVMGCIYNIPPIRSKDVPYLDVLSESVNNPIRMLAGWYMVTTTTFPPASLLVSYWMIGCYLMALKRFSEFRQINNQSRAGAYRKSFHRYTERSLLVSVTFYAAAAMLFFGAFIVRYRVELVLAFPFVALVMAVYYHLAFDENSAAQNPEDLHRHRGLMVSCTLCAVAMATLLIVEIPILQQVFAPTMQQHGLTAPARPR
jgi:decaprenyl-phosphate phosphoribosyltransferase